MPAAAVANNATGPRSEFMAAAEEAWTLRNKLYYDPDYIEVVLHAEKQQQAADKAGKNSVLAEKAASRQRLSSMLAEKDETLQGNKQQSQQLRGTLPASPAERQAKRQRLVNKVNALKGAEKPQGEHAFKTALRSAEQKVQSQAKSDSLQEQNARLAHSLQSSKIMIAQQDRALSQERARRVEELAQKDRALADLAQKSRQLTEVQARCADVLAGKNRQLAELQLRWTDEYNGKAKFYRQYTLEKISGMVKQTQLDGSKALVNRLQHEKDIQVAALETVHATMHTLRADKKEWEDRYRVQLEVLHGVQADLNNVNTGFANMVHQVVETEAAASRQKQTAARVETQLKARTKKLEHILVALLVANQDLQCFQKEQQDKLASMDARLTKCYNVLELHEAHVESQRPTMLPQAHPPPAVAGMTTRNSSMLAAAAGCAATSTLTASKKRSNLPEPEGAAKKQKSQTMLGSHDQSSQHAVPAGRYTGSKAAAEAAAKMTGSKGGRGITSSIRITTANLGEESRISKQVGAPASVAAAQDAPQASKDSEVKAKEHQGKQRGSRGGRRQMNRH